VPTPRIAGGWNGCTRAAPMPANGPRNRSTSAFTV
jgi:hypothetical protein